ncbi:T9SS C-terminal target domain-containing protein [Marinilabiliaceae bacterium JC017]|nr:T9SS C-terminal target domain-containing protein [Marinilabiliaceae bacterium JC017]
MQKLYVLVFSVLACVYSFGQGPGGGSIEFSTGQLGYVSIPKQLPESGTLEFQIKPKSFFNYNSVFDNSVGGNDWEMWIYEDGRVAARVASGSDKLEYNLNDLNGPDTWYHMAFSWQKKESGKVDYSLWVNGEKKSEKMDQTWIDPGENFYFNGGNAGNHKGDKGGDNSFDEIRLWNTPLTIDQLAKVTGKSIEESTVNAIDGLTWENLLLYYPCDEATGETLNDKTGHVNAQITGTFVRNSNYPCNISLNSNPAGAGSVSGAGGYQVGDLITLEAVSTEYCTFSHWSLGDDEVSKDATYSFQAQAGDFTYTAHYNMQYTFEGGDGSVNDPYQVATLGQLRQLSEITIMSDKYFILVKDIDATDSKNWNEGKGFQPIGSEAAPFTGSFKGQGHAISHLTINREEEINVGLFGYTSSSTITDIVLDNPVIKGKEKVGAFAGKATGIFENCIVIQGDIQGSERSIGGLIGVLSSPGDIKKCYTTGMINAPSASKVGGLIGTNSGKASDCFSLASVTGKSNVGGLIGYNFMKNYHCYAAGKVTAESSAGGVIGYSVDKSQSFLYWDKSTSGQATSAGSYSSNGLTTGAFATKSRFSNWDFNNIWCMADLENVQRPMLKRAQFIYWDQKFENVNTGDIIPLEATSNSGRPVQYTSSDRTIAYIENNELHVKANGEVTITAAIQGDDQWIGTNNMQVVKKTIQISKKQLQIIIDDLQQVYDGNEKEVTVTTVPEGIEVNVKYIKQGTNWGFARDAGTYEVEVTSANEGYVGRATATLVIAKGTPKIVWDQDLNQVDNGDEIPLVASSERFLLLDFKTTTPDLVELSQYMDNYKLRAIKPGEAKVTAYVLADKNWKATELTRTFTVHVYPKELQISIDDLQQVYDGNNKEVTITTEPEGVAVRVTYTNNGLITDVANEAGSYEVKVTSADPDYQGSASVTLVIDKGTPVIDWDQDLSQVKVGDEVSLVASNDLNNKMYFKTTTPDLVDVIENLGNYKFKALKPGEATVTVFMQPSTNWNGAELTRTITIQTPTVLDIITVQKVQVMPNPTHDKVAIINGCNGAPYLIFNLSGELVMEGILTSDSNAISLGELPNGIYLLQTTGVNNQSVIKKVVKH